MLSDYPINSRVSVRITDAFPFGLLGQVEGGPKAIIRNREIAWGNDSHAEEYVGQTRHAVVIGFNTAYKELEVSLRFAERDPWQEAGTKYRPRTAVQGQVVGLIEKAVFVELEPGVEGFLPVSELPLDPAERLADWVWLDDHVKAMVVNTDPLRRRIRLSLRALLTRREVQFNRRIWRADQETVSDMTLAEYLPKDIRLKLLQMGRPLERPVRSPDVHVLIVEDDDTYAGGLESLLKRNGCQVTRMGDGIKALHSVRTHPGLFDLILIDWNLPGLKGHEVIHRLQQEGCSSRPVLILEPAPLAERPEVLETLRNTGVDVVSKADGEMVETGLLTILRELRQEGSSVPQRHRRYWPDVVPISPQDVRHLPSGAATTFEAEGWESLKAALERLRRDTQATTVTLLAISAVQHRLRVECLVGEPFFPPEMPPDLIHSPLEDVLKKGQEIVVRVKPGSRRFKRLLALGTFQGFLGVPLPDTEASSHGLILLKQAGGFSANAKRQARLAAYLVAGALQERRLLRSLQPWQAQNVAGQVVGSAIHEINNKLGGSGPQVKSLQENVKILVCQPERAEDATFVRQLERAVEGVARAQQEAERLRDQYLRLTASDEVRPVDLKSLIQEMVRLLRPQAQSGNIHLECKLPAELPSVEARPSQLRQILLNLLLNAIQQMMQLERSGDVTVETTYAPDSPWPIQIRIVDDGPGIHTQLRERIFDFGFTTKKTGGAGLGLTISRQVAESLEGRLRVEQSHILWGTTFLLELPEGVGND